MKTLIIISLAFAIIPIICVYIYTKIMLAKKRLPAINLTAFKQDIDCKCVDEIEQMINSTIKNAENWITLSALFMSIYYLLNIWSIVSMCLNLLAVYYYNELHITLESLKICIVCFSTLSVLFSMLDNWMSSKEKSKEFHENWFNTSIIIRRYIATIPTIDQYDQLCNATKAFIEELHRSIKNTDFF